MSEKKSNKSIRKTRLKLNKLIDWEEDMSLFEYPEHLNLSVPLDRQLHELLESLQREERRAERHLNAQARAYLYAKAVNHTLTPRRFAESYLGIEDEDAILKAKGRLSRAAATPQAHRYLEVIKRKRLICEGIRNQYKNLLLWKLAKENEQKDPQTAVQALQELNRHEQAADALYEHIKDVKADPRNRPKIILEHRVFDDTDKGSDNNTHSVKKGSSADDNE